MKKLSFFSVFIFQKIAHGHCVQSSLPGADVAVRQLGS